MGRKVAVLGHGRRGNRWAQAFFDTGWEVAVFDPQPKVAPKTFQHLDTISAAVNGADWIICCLPDRLELLQKVVQRAQSTAPDHAVVGVVSSIFSAEEAQSCAILPSRVLVLGHGANGALNADITSISDGDVRQEATLTLAEISAAMSLSETEQKPRLSSAKSA